MKPWMLVLTAYLLYQWALFIPDSYAMLLGLVLLAVSIGVRAITSTTDERSPHGPV